MSPRGTWRQQDPPVLAMGEQSKIQIPLAQTCQVKKNV